MDITKDYKLHLDKETNQDLIKLFKVDVIVFTKKDRYLRFKTLLERYEDNNLSIAFIGIKLKTLLITNKRYELETKRNHIKNSNKRIIEAMNKILKN